MQNISYLAIANMSGVLSIIWASLTYNLCQLECIKHAQWKGIIYFSLLIRGTDTDMEMPGLYMYLLYWVK